MSILKYVRPLKQKPDLPDPSGMVHSGAEDVLQVPNSALNG